MINGRFFDGQTAKPRIVELELTERAGQPYLIVYEQGSVLFDKALSQVKVDEHFAGAGRRIELANDAVIDVADHKGLSEALKQVGYKEGLARNMQTSWRWAIGGVFLAIGVGILTYLYGIPLIAKTTVAFIPEKVDRYIGEQAWASVEKDLFMPSKLPQERQDHLRSEFAKIAQAIPNAPSYKVEFRASKMGPNAIALPDGKIVFTDEIIKLAEDDRALQGVFAHELGHVKSRHSMRNILQVTAVSAMIAVWFGDASNLILAVPTALASLKYSRDIEVEADDFALAAMAAARVSTEPMAQLFAKFPKDSIGLPSSHPVTEDRIKKFSKPAT
jgi:Zn-dependent protease with chaperone function